MAKLGMTAIWLSGSGLDSILELNLAGYLVHLSPPSVMTETMAGH